MEESYPTYNGFLLAILGLVSTSHLQFQPSFNNHLGFFLLSMSCIHNKKKDLATSAKAPKIKEHRKPTCKSSLLAVCFKNFGKWENCLLLVFVFSIDPPIFGGTSDRLFFQTLKLTETVQEIPINSELKSCNLIEKKTKGPVTEHYCKIWFNGWGRKKTFYFCWFFLTFAPTRKSFRSFRPKAMPSRGTIMIPPHINHWKVTPSKISYFFTGTYLPHLRGKLKLVDSGHFQQQTNLMTWGGFQSLQVDGLIDFFRPT